MYQIPNNLKNLTYIIQNNILSVLLELRFLNKKKKNKNFVLGKGRQNLIRQLFGKVRLRCLIYNKHWFKCKLHVRIKTS